jgi:NAD dependent epimerase/dehydratase family enzyme
VRNQVFTKTLAKVLRRPTFMIMPAAVLKVLLGEMSVLLLGGQRARPARLQAAGFTFRYLDLTAALSDVTGRH